MSPRDSELHDEGTRSGRGSWTKTPPAWSAYIALAVSLLTFGKVVFFSGSQFGTIETHLEFNDRRLDGLEGRQERDEEKMEPAIELMTETSVEDKLVADDEKAAIQELRQEIAAMRNR